MDRRARAVSRDHGVLHATLGRGSLELSAALLAAPLTMVFLFWSGPVLSAKRLARRELMPFAHRRGDGARAVLGRCDGLRPAPLQHYATRYGVIGAVFAMISALFCDMVIVVGSAAAGREVDEELERIRRGERPAEDEVRRQWDEITAQGRSQWETLR